MKVLFTRTNAAEMARRSHGPNSARHLQPEITPVMIASAVRTAEDRRRATLAQQIDLLDNLIAKAGSGDKVLRLISAKAKLWELLYPKPGSLRPKQSRQDRAPIQPIQPLPVDTLPALVVPEIEQSHKSENVQS